MLNLLHAIFVGEMQMFCLILICDFVQHHIGLHIQLTALTGQLVLQRVEVTHTIKYISICWQICGGSSALIALTGGTDLFIKYFVI